MVIETNTKEKRRHKSVLLFSGGMDCLCLNQIYKPDILLHILMVENIQKLKNNVFKN